MAEEQLANFGNTTLAEDLDASELGVDVANGAVFPSTGNFRINVDDEIMLVTSRSSNTLTVTRGAEGTTGATHSNGATVKQVLTAAGLATAVDQRGATSLYEDATVGTESWSIDRANGATQYLTLTGNPTFTITGAYTDRATDIRLILKQDGTGGRTVAAWPGTVTWATGSAPVLQTAAAAIDTIGLVSVDDGTSWIGYHVRTALATPVFVGIGSSATGTGDITPTIHASTVANDIMLLFVQTSNQAVTAPAGWTQLGPQVGFGTAAAAASVRLSIFWKRHDGSEVDPTVTDPGDHAVGQVMTIRGCPTTGDPFESVGQTRKRTASTTGTADGGATSWDACLVVNAFAHGLDSASAVFSSFTNADLTSVTERIDVATADGTGGGIGVCTGIKALAGSFVGSTVTETSTTDVSSTFVMLPAGTRPLSDRQVFTTPGYADTWYKRSGAKLVDKFAIGGGASGSAGRNAATAAGGGGGGGGMQLHVRTPAVILPATLTVTAGAGGAATAHVDGTAAAAGAQSSVVASGLNILIATGGFAAGVSASGSGGTGGNGGGRGASIGAATGSYTTQIAGGGVGGTTASAGGFNIANGGGAGAGGGTTQAASAGGTAMFGAGGGGGGRSNTNVGTGGSAVQAGELAGGATAGANGADSPHPGVFGGSGAAGGTSAVAAGAGGWPGGGGGGGGSTSGAQGGGAGGDGVVVIVTTC